MNNQTEKDRNELVSSNETLKETFETSSPEMMTTEDVILEGDLATMYLKGQLKEIRRMKGYSQKDIIKLTGLSAKTIHAIETPLQDGNPTLKSLLRYLAVLGGELIVGERKF